MGVKEDKINLLIKLFEQRKSMTLEDIERELDVKTRYAKQYLSLLRNNLGIDIKCTRGVYELKEGSAHLTDMSILSKQDIRRLKLIHMISRKNGMTQNEIINLFLKYDNDDEDDIKKVNSKTIMRDIKDSISKGHIYMEKDKYYVNNDIETIDFINTIDLEEFMGLCNSYGSNMPFYNELINLRDKLMVQGDIFASENDIYSIGRKYKDKMSINNFLKSIEEIDYRKHTVYVEYVSKIGLIKTDIQVVVLLYSWDKDKGYIIGRVGEDLYFVDVDTIKVFAEKDETNKYFKDKEIMDKIHMMFGASMDGPYKVEVEFDNIYNIREKIDRLIENRSNAHITPHGDVFVYEDEIYGLNDLANYLRRFGASCRVKEPQELRSLMLRTYKRILTNYEVINDGE